MDEIKKVRCAIYTRKSHEDGLEQEFNSLDAQYEAGENYVASQKFKGWEVLPERYDDGGFSGGNTSRPALQKLMDDVRSGKVDIVVVYKLDRLSRSLLDFMNLADFFEQHNVSFVSVTQDINTSTSAGRMMLNILMTFAQYEREVIAERIRDKIAGAKRRGKHCGGMPVLGYDTDKDTKKLVINETEAKLVKLIYDLYLQHASAKQVAIELNKRGHRTKSWITRKGKKRDGNVFTGQQVNSTLNNVLYVGKIRHRDKTYEGEHEAIIDKNTWNDVHQLLKGNLVARVSSKNATFSTFKGLLRCGYCGGALGITYTQKKAKRYYYYICRKEEKHIDNCCPLVRIPCGDIEKVIIHELGRLFRTPTMLLNISNATPELETSQIAEVFSSIDFFWSEMFPGEQTRLARLLVESVIVFRDKLHINIKKPGLEAMIRELEIDGDTDINNLDDELVTLTVPLKIKRQHGRKIIISPKTDTQELDPLAKRLAQAHQWNNMLISGEVTSVKDLANRLNLDSAKVGHTIRMTTLAPELQHAILSGDCPVGLNTNTIRKAIPDDWQEQMKIYQ